MSCKLEPRHGKIGNVDVSEHILRGSINGETLSLPQIRRCNIIGVPLPDAISIFHLDIDITYV